MDDSRESPGTPASPDGSMRRLSRERLSRGLFVLPTLFTVGNLFCGYLSIWCSIRGTFEIAALPDHRRGGSRRAGRPYRAPDELRLRVRRGVRLSGGPRLLRRRSGRARLFLGAADFHRLGWMASFLFVVCGSMRLARFNIQTHVVGQEVLHRPSDPGGRRRRSRRSCWRRRSAWWIAGLDGGPARPDDHPLVPDDLDDPLSLLQGSRPAAPPARLDPSGDRRRLRGDRLPARRSRSWPSPWSSPPPAPRPSSPASSAASHGAGDGSGRRKTRPAVPRRTRLVSPLRFRLPFTGSWASVQSEATSAPEAARR